MDNNSYLEIEIKPWREEIEYQILHFDGPAQIFDRFWRVSRQVMSILPAQIFDFFWEVSRQVMSDIRGHSEL